MEDYDFNKLREQMVSYQIASRGITDEKVLGAFRAVARHSFVPSSQLKSAYEDYPLPIGAGQTISQPYIVALMTKVLEINGGEKVLEIGTGSGYQAAILAHLGAEVYSIERIPALAAKAKQTLCALGYSVMVEAGDGTLGWPEHAPYDRIIVTAAAPSVSSCWIEQLLIRGKIVLPEGAPLHQQLMVVTKISGDSVKKESICGCIFVPLIGKYGYKE